MMMMSTFIALDSINLNDQCDEEGGGYRESHKIFSLGDLNMDFILTHHRLQFNAGKGRDQGVSSDFV